jgi:hypothetical protein
MRPIPGSTVSQRVAQRDRPNSAFDKIRNGFRLPVRELRFHKVRWMAECPLEILSWPRPACCYLMGHFNPGWPYDRDYLAARRTRVPLIKLWACGHHCLYARSSTLQREARLHR